MTKAKNKSEVSYPGTLEHWQRLMDDAHAPLREAAAAIDARQPSEVQRLRRDWPVELVRVAIELAEARRRAAKKFGPEMAARLVCDVAGVEQASSLQVARYKAARFLARAHGPERIIDLCCGIGGDAMELAKIAPVLAVDKSDVRAWMAGVNASCGTLVADAEAVDVEGAAVHIDPSRRTGPGRRVWKYEDYQPGPAYLERLLRSGAEVCIKLGPGVELESLPFPNEVECEMISEDGNLVQALMWRGRVAIAAGERRATMLREGEYIESFAGMPGEPVEYAALGHYVYTIDPSIERAGLLGAFCINMGVGALHPKVGLLTDEKYIERPWLRAFEVQAFMPWRVDRVRRWLGAHGAGIVEVKTRGRVIDPDVVQRQLRGVGEEPYTVFVLRMGKTVSALVCRRL